IQRSAQMLLPDLDGCYWAISIHENTHPTMISEVFHEYFEDLVLPVDIPCCEISRLFLDKQRRDESNLRGVAVSKALFLAMIIYCLKKGYQGMHAIVSRGMYAIFRQANWKVQVLRKGLSEKGETIYYIFMPANENIIEEIISKDKKNLWLREMLRQLQGLTLSDIQ
uniref:acyl-homoserine-lactone synthase n=1 Tax=Enterobacter asburiae TaxID=61645 RepID=UPI002915D1F8